MADDTRQPTDPTHQAFRALPRDPSQEEHKKPRAFLHRPNEDSASTTILSAAKTIQLDDFSKVHTTPCVRNALLPAIGGGMVIGAGRFVLGGSIMMACNWASGSFVGVSLLAYNYCQRRRTVEKEGIRRAVEVLDKKQAMKDLQEKALKMGEAGAGGKVTAASVIPPRETPSTGGPQNGTPFWASFKFW